MTPEGDYWTRDDLRRQGLSDSDIRRLHRQGRIHRLVHGLYTREPPEGVTVARALAHRYPDLTFTGHTALSIRGHRATFLMPTTGVVPAGHRALDTGYLVAPRSRTIRRHTHDGLPVVSSVAAVAGDTWLNRLSRIKALEKDYAGFDGRDRFEADCQTLSAEQRRNLEPLLKRTVIGASSRMERLFHLDVRGMGLDAIPNFRFGPYTWDLGFPEATTLVDLDSARFHTSENERSFMIDRWKANHAEMAGWGHLQFTDLCLDDPLARKVALQEIRALVEHRRHLPTPTGVPGRVTEGLWDIHGGLKGT